MGRWFPSALDQGGYRLQSGIDVEPSPTKDACKVLLLWWSRCCAIPKPVILRDVQHFRGISSAFWVLTDDFMFFTGSNALALSVWGVFVCELWLCFGWLGEG